MIGIRWAMIGGSAVSRMRYCLDCVGVDMATLYVGEPFWTDRNPAWEVTATGRAEEYISQTDFEMTVADWLAQHRISFRKTGNTTKSNSAGRIYQYHIRIADEQARTLFTLRWS